MFEIVMGINDFLIQLVKYWIILADREERIVHVQGEAIFDERRTPVQTRGTIQDITDRKKAEERIQTLANAVESSDDAIVTNLLKVLLQAGIKAQSKFMVIQLKKFWEKIFQYLNQLI